MKTRAAVLREMELPPPYAESRPLHIEEVELDPPGEGEVLVEVRAAGLCHSDLSVINGDRPRPTPMALGHEAAGIVRELGAGVKDLRTDDHVVMVFVPSCGHCLPCMEGRPALCEPGFHANSAGALLSGARRLHRNDEAINHHMGVSAFAEYAVVSRQSLIKVDSELPFDEAALFGCAVLTGVGAVVHTARVPPAATVAVVGLGGVGVEVARRAHGLGMRVIGIRRSSREGPVFVEYVGLPDELYELAGRADVIVNALPLTSETRGLFDTTFFHAAKPGTYFISVGRGASTVTADLIAALKDGRLTAAGLDVTDPEPLPAGHELWSLPNVIITPHVSATTDQGRWRRWTITLENLRRYVNGDKMLNVVDVAQGY